MAKTFFSACCSATGSALANCGVSNKGALSNEKRKPDMKRSLRYSKIKHNFEKGLKETVMWYKEYYTK